MVSDARKTLVQFRMSQSDRRPSRVARLVTRVLFLITIATPAYGQAEAAVDGYVVREGDQLQIRVWPDSSLGGLYPVEDDGAVYLPIIGRLEVAGLPLNELRRELRERFGREMRNPTVSVTPRFRVSVLGAVQRPGLYEVTPTQGVIDAISLAGGFRENAKEDEVEVVRNGDVIVVNAEGGHDRSQAIGLNGLRSGDRILVPRGWSIGVTDILYGLQSVAILVTLIVQAQER